MGEDVAFLGWGGRAAVAGLIACILLCDPARAAEPDAGAIGEPSSAPVQPPVASPPPPSFAMQDLGESITVRGSGVVLFPTESAQTPFAFFDVEGSLPFWGPLQVRLRLPFAVGRYGHMDPDSGPQEYHDDATRLGNISVDLQGVHPLSGRRWTFGWALRLYVPSLVGTTGVWAEGLDPESKATYAARLTGVEARLAVGYSSPGGFFEIELDGAPMTLAAIRPSHAEARFSASGGLLGGLRWTSIAALAEMRFVFTWPEVPSIAAVYLTGGVYYEGAWATVGVACGAMFLYGNRIPVVVSLTALFRP